MHIQRTYDPHRDLLELRSLERPACSNTLVPRGSHHISSLWSPVVATGGKRRQMPWRQKPGEQAKTVATGCHRLPEKFHGKEGVSGSSPPEGSAKALHTATFVALSFGSACTTEAKTDSRP